MEYPFKDLLPLDEVLAREGYYKDWTHLDPEVFYSLTQISEYIKTKGYGVDVRLLIAQLAEHFGLKTTQVVDLGNLIQAEHATLKQQVQQAVAQVNADRNALETQFNQSVAQMKAEKDAVIANATVDSEVILARGGKPTLQARLDDTTAQLAQTNAQVDLLNRGLGETFATLVALQTAYPTGDTKDHIVGADGHRYFWNDTAWADGGVYQAVEVLNEGVTTRKIATKGVTPDKIFGSSDFLNWFDESKTTLDTYIKSDGSLEFNNAYRTYYEVTDYIPVKLGDTLTILGYGSTTNILGVGFDANLSVKQVFNTYLNQVGAEGSASQYQTITISNANIRFLRINILSGTNKMVIKNAAYPSSFVPYGLATLSWLDMSAYAQKTELEALKETAQPQMYVKKVGTSLKIKWKYNNNNDFLLEFKPGGVNNTPTINNARTVPNTSPFVNSDFDGVGETLITGSTDWISPYQFDALLDGDTDAVDFNGFTGGWHGLTNLTGLPTSRNISYDVYLDDKLITVDGVYIPQKIKIMVTNRVQARNTVKNDGTGREVMKETVTYLITKGSIKPTITVEALEDMSMVLWYGLQTHNSGYAGKMTFANDNLKNYWFDVYGTGNDYAGNKAESDCDTMIATNNNNYLVMRLDKNYGAGRLRNMSATGMVLRHYRVNANSNNTKCYFSLIDQPTNLLAGRSLSARGEYKFYYLSTNLY